MPMVPSSTHITGLTHHCSCRFSHLSPHLNSLNLPHARFFLFVIPLSGPNSFCPVLSGHGGKFLLYNKTIYFHQYGQKNRTLFTCCCCHLSPLFQPLRGSHHHCMDSPGPSWHHTRTQQLLDLHLHVTLLKCFTLFCERESHLALLPPRFFFCSPNLFTLVLMSQSVSTLSAIVTPLLY